MHLQEERQQRLREHARRLIAETRAKSLNLDSPSSPIKSITHQITLSPERTISPINNIDGFTITSKSTSKETSPTKYSLVSSPRITPQREMSPEKNGNSPSLQSFNSVMENLTLSPHREKKVWKRIDWHTRNAQI